MTKSGDYPSATVVPSGRNPAIIRSRAKIEAAIGNDRAYLEVDDLSNFVWTLAGSEPARNYWQTISKVPASTALSIDISAALKKRGFQFCGPVIVYAWMQTTGMVNDHVAGCFRFTEPHA